MSYMKLVRIEKNISDLQVAEGSLLEYHIRTAHCDSLSLKKNETIDHTFANNHNFRKYCLDNSPTADKVSDTKLDIDLLYQTTFREIANLPTSQLKVSNALPDEGHFRTFSQQLIYSSIVRNDQLLPEEVCSNYKNHLHPRDCPCGNLIP